MMMGSSAFTVKQEWQFVHEMHQHVMMLRCVL